MKSEDELREQLEAYQRQRWELRAAYEREERRLTTRINYLTGIITRLARQRKKGAFHP